MCMSVCAVLCYSCRSAFLAPWPQPYSHTLPCTPTLSSLPLFCVSPASPTPVPAPSLSHYPLSRAPAFQDYRGPEPASELETQAIMGFLRRPDQFSHSVTGAPFRATFSIAFNFHSYAE
jgi:hypothetical protein